MIVTKNWLNEWIDLSGIDAVQLCKTLNAIGLEVDRHEQIAVTSGVVIGLVQQCEKHPDADKLNVCQVDLGNSVKQIVCGASNVREGIYVAVATVGTKLPNGLEIKEAVLRGVDSHGMICSSSEIGLPSMGEGIMILDASIGELILGKNLGDYDDFNDDIIEIELTANRGDCLSIHGVARDLCAALNKELRERKTATEIEGRLGIGRILQLQHSLALDIELLYGAVDVKELKLPFCVAYRMAIIGENYTNNIDTLLKYSTHSTGVILRCYPFEVLEDVGNSKSVITLKDDENGYAALFGNLPLSVIGVSQNEEARFVHTEGLVIVEASYIAPDVIAQKMGEKKISTCPHYYHASRGSEPALNSGLDYAMGLLGKYTSSTIYGGRIELSSSFETRSVTIDEDEFEAFIGMKVDKTTLTQILKNLGMSISKPKPSTFSIAIPRFRHDIVNKQDIIEEIVRIVGIDNIPSKPLTFTEKNQMTDDWVTYKKIRSFRQRSAQSGFFESVHFVFNEKIQCDKFGFVSTHETKELLNPITATFDTLRPTLLLGLLNSASANAKVNQKKIALFESGAVFDAHRHESRRLAFVASGSCEDEKIANSGKAPNIDLRWFAQKIGDIIGTFTMLPHVASHSMAHPYICAKVILDGVEIGEIFRLHPTVEEEYDMSHTFMCELDMDKLPYGLIQAQSYSKYQASYRDISIIVPSAMAYSQIKTVIENHLTTEVKKFYPVDRYVSESLGENVSLSIRFVLQSEEKTLEEEEITACVDAVLNGLNSELGVGLR
jgi:phenylalanyl-tRNA synthetase beta chain